MADPSPSTHEPGSDTDGQSVEVTGGPLTRADLKEERGPGALRLWLRCPVSVEDFYLKAFADLKLQMLENEEPRRGLS